MKHDDLSRRLRDEAALCRNETADDVARLLDEAADALEASDRELAAARLNERRLTYMINSRARICHSRDGDLWWLGWPTNDEGDMPQEHYQVAAFNTPDAAIDAAIDAALAQGDTREGE